MKQSRLFVFMYFALLTACISIAPAQVPKVLYYEGYLTGNGGQPLNGKKDLTFSLYGKSTGGDPIWQEVHQNIQISAGAFHVVLGRGTVPQPLDIPFDQQYYLGVSVGHDPEMSPRQELMPSAYSLRAATADQVADSSISSSKLKPNSVTDDKIQSVSFSKITGMNDGVSARVWSRQGNNNTDPNTDFLGTSDEKDLIFRTNNLQRMTLLSGGNVGIGTTTPSVKLQVQTDVNQHGFAHTDGIHNILTWLGTSEGIEGAWIGPSFSHALSLQTGNSARLTISGSGDVGIGTVTPSQRFHVVGNSLFAGDMKVNGLSTLNDATVLGDLTAAGNFTVSGTGEFADLNVLGDATVGHNLSVNNRLNVSGDASGAPESESNYIAMFENASTGTSANGVAIKLNGKSSTTGVDVGSSNNFITFFNGSTNKVVGRIEGQTIGEYIPGYYIDAALNGAKLGALFAASPIDPGALIAQIAESAVWYTRATIGLVNVGISYQSGAGDYAEWLPRLHENEVLAAGDVVGVTGGKITRATKGAERVMVVSSNPIVLGNMPDEKTKERYEKVAFLGQVAVNVVGKVEEGDYIVASGRGDGSAVAISPKLMTADELPATVGRAWASSVLTYKKQVNVAVGLSNGDIAPIMKNSELRVHELKTMLEQSSQSLLDAQERITVLESGLHALDVQHDELEQLKTTVKALQQAAQRDGSLQAAKLLSQPASNDSEK